MYSVHVYCVYSVHCTHYQEHIIVCLKKTIPPSLPVFRFFLAEPLLGNVLLEPGPVAFSLFFHRFNMSVFLNKWKYILTGRSCTAPRQSEIARARQTRRRHTPQPVGGMAV